MLFNVQSEYSLLNSTLRLKDYVTKAKESGYQSIGLADRHVLTGVLEFQELALNNGLKPLIGLTVNIKGLNKGDKEYPFLLYAKNYQGYLQLIKISRLLENFQSTDREVWSYLKTQPLELVYISVGGPSEIEQSVIHENIEQAYEILNQFYNIFGEENVYLGINAYPQNQLEMKQLTSFAKSMGIKQVASQLVNSLHEDEAFSLQILNAIKNNEVIDDSTRYTKGNHYLMERQKLESLYKEANLTNIWENTLNLSEKLNVKIDTSQSYLPKFKTPENFSSAAFLQKLTQDRLKEIQKDSDSEYISRLAYELGVIDKMEFSDYFLIVWDIIKFCHERGIRVGPGRGSAAGSLVSYLLQITLVDPIEYDLLFERFLNPERYNMPDIDVDIPDNKRDEVLHFIKDRYGHEQVAQIITMGTFGAKASVRDTLRVIGEDSNTLKKWSRAIPSDQNQSMSLQRAIRESSELSTIVNENVFNREIFEASLTIEGLPRHSSTHAAAVVINDFPLDTIIPVKDRENDLLLTQFTMNDVEKMGLLKMDFLGLRNLTILDDIINNIKMNKGIHFDVQSIPMNDLNTLKIFQKADTNGVFQFESDGIKEVLKKLKPERFEDIVAVNALYRPGPMKQIDTFIRRKHGREEITYIHPILEPILKNTYGIIIYQEQVMQIVVDMAGFSLGEADILRRAMGKKQVDVMQREREHFIKGALSKGHTQEAAEQVYNYIYEFSNYGFNRAHAVVYSTLAYQLAYLKANFTEEFFQAILNNGRSQLTSYGMYIQEAKRHLGKILPLDINLSQGYFIVDKGLRIGFASVKGIRRELVNHILEDRSTLGNYKSFINFLQRLPIKLLQIDLIKPLIHAGAFDGFGYNRRTLVENLPAQMKYIEFSGESMSLFQEMEPKFDWHNEYQLMEKLEFEKEALGFTLSGHPLDAYKDIIDNDSLVYSIQSIRTFNRKRKIKVIGIIEMVKTIRTKRNELMSFISIGDEFDTIDIVVFPLIFQRVQYLLQENNIVVIEGTIGFDRNGQIQIVADRIYNIKNYQRLTQSSTVHPEISRCFIQVKDFEQSMNQIEQLKRLALENNGPATIILVDRHRQTIQLDPPFMISYSYRVQQQVSEIFGNSNVVFK
ncbi:DNA polymerase III subunit alpha [Aerococcaceae bacterium WGS1372]